MALSVSHPRSRSIYALIAIVVIFAGLLSRRFPQVVPAFLGKYPGDALWALMMFLLVAMVLRGSSTWTVGLVALGIAFADEFSQMYHAPWIDAIRQTTAGHLVLGSTFAWGDLAAYAVGVAGGMMGEAAAAWFRERMDRSGVSTKIT